MERALKFLGKELDTGSQDLLERYTDWSNVDKYAQESISKLVANGIISGDGTKLKPLSSSTRAEAAMMIYRAIH
ncbi:Endo-1,4-beta-xylanase A precursor [compost metagenome]